MVSTSVWGGEERRGATRWGLRPGRARTGECGALIPRHGRGLGEKGLSRIALGEQGSVGHWLRGSRGEGVSLRACESVGLWLPGSGERGLSWASRGAWTQAAGDRRGLGEKGLSRVSVDSRLPLSTPCTRPTAWRFWTTVFPLPPFPHPSLAFCFSGARTQPFPRPHFLFSAEKAGAGETPGDKDACATVTFPPEKGGNSLCSVRVRAEALRV